MGIWCKQPSSSSNLMCAEECSSILQCHEEEEEEEFMATLLERELALLPSKEYAEKVKDGGWEATLRRSAIDWILKVHSCYNFEPSSVCLSVSYLDRFLSKHEIPRNKGWMQQLLAVACLSIAVRMLEEARAPLLVDLQVAGGEKFVFEERTIQRMELLVLSTLEWRMLPATPFLFLGYYFRVFQAQAAMHLRRCAKLILRTLQGAEFLDFQPSEIAAAAVLSVVAASGILDLGKALSVQVLANKERVMKCYHLVQELATNRGKIENSISRSPNGVLDAAAVCSSRSDQSADLTSPACKKRRSNLAHA